MKKLLLLSGKGGTGKTTTAASFIRFAGARAVADCDVDAPNLHIVTEMDAEPEIIDFTGSDKAFIDSGKCTECGICAEKCKFDAIKLHDGRYEISEYMCEGCGVCSYVCPAGAVSMEKDKAGIEYVYKDVEKKVFSSARLKMGRGNSGKLVSEVKNNLMKAADTENAEIAIIDGSPGIGCPVISSVSGVDLVLIVAEPSVSGINDLGRLVRTAETFDVRVCICVNKWDTSPDKAAEIERFARENGIAFVGKVPYDKTASEAINSGLSVADFDCPARTALLEVYRNTMKEIGLEKK